jgi:hypothetical protein
MGSMGMAKGLTLFTMVVAAIIVLVFGLDLAAKFPFGRPQGAILLDASFVVCGLLLAYIGWTTFRELE